MERKKLTESRKMGKDIPKTLEDSRVFSGAAPALPGDVKRHISLDMDTDILYKSL